MDYDSHQLVNYYQYRLDLLKANNATTTPEFDLYYNAKDLYSLPDLKPNSWK